MFPTLAERLADAAQKLANVTETPRLDAEILLAHALDISRAGLLARFRDRPDAPGFDEFLRRRLAHEPLAYILGAWEFFSLTFKVVPPLLVPRPETEHLVEAVLEFIKDTEARVLEIGTGTGCVAVAIAHNAPSCRVVATDICAEALETAAHNAVRHRLERRIEFRQGDLFEPVRSDAPFDAICSNPPYVEDAAWGELSPVITRYEDPQALLAGKDGLDVIRRLAAEAPAHLEPGGLLAFEIGMGQRHAVETILRENGYDAVEFRHDLAGTDRIACARAPSPPVARL